MAIELQWEAIFEPNSYGFRMGRHPEANKKVAYLLNQQKGKCSHCGNRFNMSDFLS
jgi:retron-type reverse transcriptase